MLLLWILFVQGLRWRNGVAGPVGPDREARKHRAREQMIHMTHVSSPLGTRGSQAERKNAEKGWSPHGWCHQLKFLKHSSSDSDQAKEALVASDQTSLSLSLRLQTELFSLDLFLLVWCVEMCLDQQLQICLSSACNDQAKEIASNQTSLRLTANRIVPEWIF